jgi:hypothetical protein
MRAAIAAAPVKVAESLRTIFLPAECRVTIDARTPDSKGYTTERRTQAQA